MRSFIRSFLPVLAVLSLLVFSGPLAAGPVPTPKAEKLLGEGREAALSVLASRLPESVGDPSLIREGLQSMSTADLLALSSSVESLRSAGYHEVVITALIVGCVVFVVFVITWAVLYHEHHHRKVHEREPDRPADDRPGPPPRE